MSNILQTFDTIGVIVGRDLVGDGLIKLPFLHALEHAFPAAKIHWITSQGPTAYSTILREPTANLIDQIHETPAWLDVGTGKPTIAAPHFDLLLDTRNRWEEALRARKIPHKLFLAPAMRFLFSEQKPPLVSWIARPQHMIDRLLQLVEMASGQKAVPTGSLQVSEELQQKAKLILPDGKVYVGLAPGAGNRIKIWPRYKFEKIATHQASLGRIPVFILGPQELDWYEALQASIPTALFPLQDYNAWGTAQLTITHTLAIAQRLTVAVANDSGVGHMLAAADCPLISLFGPTSAAKLAPRVSRGRVIRAQDFNGTTSMSAILWEAVDVAIDDMIRGK